MGCEGRDCCTRHHLLWTVLRLIWISAQRDKTEQRHRSSWKAWHKKRMQNQCSAHIIHKHISTKHNIIFTDGILHVDGSEKNTWIDPNISICSQNRNFWITCLDFLICFITTLKQNFNCVVNFLNDMNKSKLGDKVKNAWTVQWCVTKGVFWRWRMNDSPCPWLYLLGLICQFPCNK